MYTIRIERTNTHTPVHRFFFCLNWMKITRKIYKHNNVFVWMTGHLNIWWKRSVLFASIFFKENRKTQHFFLLQLVNRWDASCTRRMNPFPRESAGTIVEIETFCFRLAVALLIVSECVPMKRSTSTLIIHSALIRSLFIRSNRPYSNLVRTSMKTILFGDCVFLLQQASNNSFAFFLFGK